MQDNNSTPSPEGQTPEPTPITPETPVAAPEVSAPVSTEPVTAPVVTPTPEAAAAAAVTAPAAAVQGEHPPKNFLVALLLSIFLGNLGIDRFYLGHIGLGVAKLLLNWLTFGIWWLVDVILIATKKVKNVTWEI